MKWIRQENCKVITKPLPPWEKGLSWRQRRAWKRANKQAYK